MMRSIRGRLLLGLLLLVAVMSLITGAVTYRRVLGETSNLFDYELRQMALSLADQGPFLSCSTLPPEAVNSDFVVQIWDIFGKLTCSPELPLLEKAILGYSDLTVQNARWRVYARLTRTGVIQVAQPWSMRERLAREAALRIVAPLLLLLLMMAAVAAWIVTRAVRPLKGLTRQLEQRDVHSLAPVEAAHLPAEVSPLVEELNRLLERLAGAFENQRAFVADAAHELRSPLTALSLHLQLLERAREEPDRQLATTRLREAIDRAAHLVSQLLTLARNEPEALPAAAVPCALDAIAGSATAEVEPLALARNIQIELEAPAAAMVRADAEALRVLARNLIDNAVRYSPEGSIVRVQVTHTAAGQAVLTVTDQGPGIPAADRERAFARFFRAPRAGEGGSGLGLAIVKAIAQRHGAQVTLGDAVPHGLHVVVSFPPP